MNKSTFFAGQPIFSQLLRLISKSSVRSFARELGTDRYCKYFDSYHHLVTMLYCCFQHCTSLREVVSGMAACEGRLQSAGITHLPARSTLSEANARRNYKFFEKIYLNLYHTYGPGLADSRMDKLSKRLVVIDSTTIGLFKDILKAAGCSTNDGRRKGGIKVHTAIRYSENVPFLVELTPSAANDMVFLKKLKLQRGAVVVMDRGYKSYNKFHQWSKQGITWVTRLSSYSLVEVIDERKVTTEEQAAGVLNDQEVILGYTNKKIQRVRCRLITYNDKENKRIFQFLTNQRKLKPSTIAGIYKKRWQIEILFKRLKQNMPLEYFLGDNENAVKVQIYCALISDLLLRIISKGLKRKWSHSNLASIVRLHLMNYTDIKRFLENPDKCAIINPVPTINQPSLFSSA